MPAREDRVGAAAAPCRSAEAAAPCWAAAAAALLWGAAASEPLRAESLAALRFHGTGTAQQDRVRIAIDDNVPGPDASAPCDVGAGSFTIEFWIRGTLAANPAPGAGGAVELAGVPWIEGHAVVDRDIWGASSADWGISIAGGRVRFGTGSGDAPAGNDPESTIEGAAIVLDGSWHHVACVRDAASGRKRIVVDGVLDFESQALLSDDDISFPNGGVGTPSTPWNPFIVLGAEKHDAGPAFPSFNGWLDELRIWSTARSIEAIAADGAFVVDPAAPGLVAMYRFEEGSGTIVADSSAAASPAGELIAGVPGNGEWALASDDPLNCAPIGMRVDRGRLVTSTIATGFEEPTTLEFLPDGRLLIGQRNGTIRLHHDGHLHEEPVLALPADTTNGERGLVGLAVDPQFASNGWIYAYWTTKAPRNRVSRFTLVGDVADLGSELVVWENTEPAADFHHGGALLFGPDGRLYIATGDQFDSFSAQSLASEHGKLLRVNADGTIPFDNPFVDVPGARPTIYARGLRNPFRATFDAPTGRLLIGNVGGNAADSWEELEVLLGLGGAAPGANFGWPLQEGPLCFVAECPGVSFPRWWYQHDDPAYFTNVPQGCIVVGPVYRGASFPASWQGSLIVGDYANRWIRRLSFDAAGNGIADQTVVADAGTVADIEVGPDGALWWVTVGVPWSGAPDVPALRRAAWTTGNAQPVVVASAAPTVGPAPLAVSFSSAGSFDPDGGPQALAYLWSFGDGATSTQPDPVHLYASNGPIIATLTVTDGLAEVVSAPLSIAVGVPPLPTIDSPRDGLMFIAGETIEFFGSAVDPDGGPLPDSALVWQVVLHHLDHVHPFLGPLAGVSGGAFDLPTTGHGPSDTRYEIVLTATDADGLATSTSVSLFPQPAPLSLSSDPSGIPIFLDGDPLATPAIYVSTPNFEHSLEAQSSFVIDGVVHSFACWSVSPGGAGTPGHPMLEFVTPPGGATLVARYVAAPTQDQSLVVASDDRDADWNPAFGQNLGNPYFAGQLCAGRDGDGPWQGGLAFSAPIPAGATVLSATLTLRATFDNAGSPSLVLRGYDVASTAPFADVPTALSLWHPLTSAEVVWSPPPFVDDGLYESPDLAAIVQEIVDRPDWLPGGHLGLLLDGSPTVGEGWRCWDNFSTGTAAALTIAWSTAATGDPCALPGDLDGDGLVGGADLGLLLGAWGPCPKCAACTGDLDGNCVVDGSDLGLLLGAWSG